MSENTIQYSTPIVIDVGADFIKAGMAGEDTPRVVFPTVVGNPKNHGVMVGTAQDYYVGHDAIEKQSMLNLSRPISGDVIENWDELRIILDCIFNEQLRVDTARHPVIFTGRSSNSRESRAMFAEVLFDQFNSPAIFVEHPAVLTLFAHGREAGLIVDSGYDATDIMPVFGGAITGQGCRFDIGGKHVSRHLQILLRQRTDSTAIGRDDVIENIKKNLVFMASDVYQIEAYTDPDVEYALPDGERIMIGKERMQAAEILMQPNLIGLSGPGLPELICQTIEHCDRYMKGAMYDQIILSGGNAQLSGMDERIRNEIARRSQGKSSHVTAMPEGRFATWLGGSLIASMPIFEARWYTQDNYMEHGAEGIVHACPSVV